MSFPSGNQAERKGPAWVFSKQMNAYHYTVYTTLYYRSIQKYPGCLLLQMSQQLLKFVQQSMTACVWDILGQSQCHRGNSPLHSSTDKQRMRDNFLLLSVSVIAKPSSSLCLYVCHGVFSHFSRMHFAE